MPAFEYKGLDGRALLGHALAIRKLTRRAGKLFIVNDRLDVALASGADVSAAG